MPNIFGERDETQIIGGGYGGYGYGGGGFGGLGGIGAIIALVVVVAILWFLSREGRDNDHGHGGHDMPYPYPPYAYPPYGGGNCGPLDCKIPMAVDMSNCEVDKDLWKVDADLNKCCCEQKEATHCEGEKTRALINDLNLQNVRDQLAAALAEKSSLESKFFTEKKFDQLSLQLCGYDNQIDKQFCKTDAAIAALKCDIDCNLPKRPPMWCEGITPNTHHTDCRHDDFPRRRGHDCNCGCGCND